MARLRTIKPSFFLNEELAAVPAVGRLLFAGLWCIADRRGRLEDRPSRIKVEILPYDDCDVDGLLAQLGAAGFVQRYSVDGKHYIQIANFERHQNPHIKEAESTIPAPCLHGLSTVLSVQVLDPGPDYGVLEPDISANAEVRAPASGAKVDYSREVFEQYQVRIQPKARLIEDARRKIQTRLRRWKREELEEAMAHFAADTWQMEHNAHRGAAWFFASDSRIEQYLNLKPRREERTNGATASNNGAVRGHDPGLDRYRQAPGTVAR